MTTIQNTLVLTDFSENAKSAEEYALQLTIKMCGNIILYHVYPIPDTSVSGNIVWPHDPPTSLELQSTSNLQLRVDELKGQLNKINDDKYKPEIRYLENEGSLYEKLNDIITQNNIWLVVMGTDGENFVGNLFSRSSVFKILDTISCPVLIVPPKAICNDFEKIGYATDLRSSDLLVVEWLKDLSAMLQVKLFIIHVSGDILSDDVVSDNPIASHLLHTKSPNPIYINYFQGKNIKESLQEIIEGYNVDILALVHRRYGFYDTLFHSSTSHQMIKHTKIPILVFPVTEKNK